MTLPTLIYLASFSNSLSQLLVFIAGVTFLGFIITTIAYFADHRKNKALNILSKFIAVIFLFSSLLSVIIPDKTTVYMMIGADAAQTLYTSETGNKVMQLINKKLDEALTEDSKK